MTADRWPGKRRLLPVMADEPIMFRRRMVLLLAGFLTLMVSISSGVAVYSLWVVTATNTRVEQVNEDGRAGRCTLLTQLQSDHGGPVDQLRQRERCGPVPHSIPTKATTP